MKKNPILLFLRLSRPFFLVGGFMQYSLGVGIARFLGFEIDWSLFVTGAVWVLFLNADGTVSSHQKISNTEGVFTGNLDPGDVFGWSVSHQGEG